MRVFKHVIYVVLLVIANTVFGSECEEKLQKYLSEGGREHPGFVELFPICQAEADDGNAEAIYQLSFYYVYGLAGIPEDTKRGIELIEEAAIAGSSIAQYWMGWQSEEGGMLIQDEGIALDWYRKAAESGNTLAMERLAKAYEHAHLGLTRDAEIAQEWRTKATRCDC